MLICEDFTHFLFHLEIFNKFKLFENQNEVENSKSRNLMPFFSYLAVEIAKIKPWEILSHQNRQIKDQQIINSNKEIEG